MALRSIVVRVDIWWRGPRKRAQLCLRIATACCRVDDNSRHSLSYLVYERSARRKSFLSLIMSTLLFTVMRHTHNNAQAISFVLSALLRGV